MSDLFKDAGCYVTHFGSWQAERTCTALQVTGFSPVGEGGEHAEAQRPGVIGADFTYRANVKFGQGGDAHLQFRISDEGRYGVSVRESGFRIYRQLLNSDELVWKLIPGGDVEVELAASAPHTVAIQVTGDVLRVFVDDHERTVSDTSLAVGRFGLYAFRAASSNSAISFTDISASTDPTAKSNFALLYNTLGHPLRGTKRGLVRTLNLLESGIDLAGSNFSVRTLRGRIVTSGRLTPLHTTYGMQLWEADFSSLAAPGTYVLRVEIAVARAVHVLESSAFAIEERGFTRRLLKPLTILNAEARDAAEEDLRKHWRHRTPGFHTEADGAFRVDGADDQDGALIERSKDGYGGPVPNGEFAEGYVLTGRVTILNGCDAQLQFGIAADHRYGVTLQAGSGGGCRHGGGPGAVRLHVELPLIGFQALAAYIFPDDAPVRAGVAYDLRIEVDSSSTITVYVDGIQRLQHGGSLVPAFETFGLKVWGASARFERVAAWRPGTLFRRAQIEPGIWVEQPLATPATPCDGSVRLGNGTRAKELCSPLFTQRTGFHDCNNYIGESNSHGAFLSGLVDVWRNRRDDFSTFDLSRLRRAILTATQYLEELYRDAGATGRYKHEAVGRGGDDKDEHDNYLLYLTLSGVYGEAAFAAKAADIDPDLAHAACEHAWKGCQWLAGRDALASSHKALFYHQLATSARRDPTFRPLFEHDGPPPPGVRVADWLDTLALRAGETFLIGSAGNGFAKLDTLRRSSRDTGQMIPWLEGIYALRVAYPERTTAWDAPLRALAESLAEYLLAQNAFHVIPQSSGGDENQHIWNWDHMEFVPCAHRPAEDGRDFYNATFFGTMAYDMVLLGRMTGNPKLEKLAAGHLGWVLGLNPGVPMNKALNNSSSGTVWKAAAFIQNLGAPFARGFENFKRRLENQEDVPSSAKSWLWAWEDRGVHREVWWVDPKPNGFMTIVNGHTLWEDEWDYHNMGEHGWVSGETFMLNDGLYVKAMTAYEDWVVGTRVEWASMGGPFDDFFAIANQDGRLELIATRGDGTMWHRWQVAPNGAFADWHPMDGFVSRPFGIQNLDGRIELFGRGRDGALWHRWQVAPNGPFAQWHSLEGAFNDGIAARNADGRIELFALWSDGTLRHRWQIRPNGPFAPWHVLGDAARLLAAGMNLDGRLELFIEGSDGALHHTWQTAPNSHFSEWHSLGDRVRAVTVARNQDGRLEIFIRSADNTVHHRWQTAPNAFFAQWQSLGGAVTTVRAVDLANGQIELFAIATDGGMLRNVQTVPNGPFVGWESLGSNAARFCVAANQDGRAALFARQANGELWYMSERSPGRWW